MRSSPLILLMAVLLSAPVYSQHLRLGPGGGLSFIDLPNYYSQDVSAGGLGFDMEAHAAVLGKLDLEEPGVTLTGRLQYTWMTGSGSVVSDQVDITAGDYSTFADIFVTGFGAEWGFGPEVSSSTQVPEILHLSTEILLTEVGQVTFTSSGSSSPFLKNAATRVGFAAGAGLEYPLSPTVTVDLHLRYSWNTLFCRSAEEENLNTFDASLAIYFSVF